MEGIHESEAALSAKTAAGCGEAPADGLAQAERRVAEQRMYRALVDHAYEAARGPSARDPWADAVPKLQESWEMLKEKYRYEERPEPAPQADGGSWRGKGGRTLDAASNDEIDLGYARIREVGENVIAPAILRIAAEDPTRTLAGFDRCIKGEDRLKEKVSDRMRSKGRSATEALAQIPDVVRFTFTYGETAYASGVRKDLDRLETAGFTQIERRNTWASDQYKGINTQWLEPQSGVRFEVQFHTHASLEAKELTHEAYERIRTVTESTPAAERETAELKQFQHRANSVIPIPPDVSDIDDYPPGGH
ncbi:MAG TPA: hypothetical protein VH021_17630 [Trebonia sp.]|nr:hypothetical protein [Trebonia sp.]